MYKKPIQFRRNGMRSQTRIDAVMDEIRLKISSRTYLPSHRLPSVRQQARTLQVSVSTVVEAYERLMAEGIILSKPGSGFYGLALSRHWL